jgi:hypothetical protein
MIWVIVDDESYKTVPGWRLKGNNYKHWDLSIIEGDLIFLNP